MTKEKFKRDRKIGRGIELKYFIIRDDPKCRNISSPCSFITCGYLKDLENSYVLEPIEGRALRWSS